MMRQPLEEGAFDQLALLPGQVIEGHTQPLLAFRRLHIFVSPRL
jgi:hypothetical protein